MSTNPPPGFVRASPSMQNQLHDIALAFPVPQPRKQNTACDACRTRKVKCNQTPGQDKCQHCILKNYPCTHHAQQQTEKKRQQTSRRSSRGLSSSDTGSNLQSLPLPSPVSSSNLSDTSGHSPQPTALPQSPMSQFLAYLFSPSADAKPPAFVGGYGYMNRFGASKNMDMDSDWGEVGRKLQDESFRMEFALDLIEVYFQICHTRLPLLNPTQFRARFRLSLPNHQPPPGSVNASLKPLPHALLAVVLAWGAKFSEHPLLVLDRMQLPLPSALIAPTGGPNHPTTPTPTPGGRSRLATALVDRAREVAEGERIYRLATPDNVILALLLEPLQSQSTADPDGFHGFWLSSAIRHLLEMQINHKSPVLTAPPSFGMTGEEDEKGAMVFCWWMACLADALSSAYFRRKPMLEDADYNIQDFPTNPPPALTSSQDSSTPARRTHHDFLVSVIFADSVELARTNPVNPTAQEVAEAINRTHPTWAPLAERDIFECALRLKNECEYRGCESRDDFIEDFIHYPDGSYSKARSPGAYAKSANRTPHPDVPVDIYGDGSFSMVWTSLEPVFGSISRQNKRHIRSAMIALVLTFLLIIRSLAYSTSPSTYATYILALFTDFHYLEPINSTYLELRRHIIRRKVGWWTYILLWLSTLLFMVGLGRAARWFACPVVLWLWNALVTFETHTKASSATSQRTRQRTALLSVPSLFIMNWWVGMNRKQLLAGGSVIRFLLRDEHATAGVADDRTDLTALLTIACGWMKWGMDLELYSTFALYTIWLGVALSIKPSLS